MNELIANYNEIKTYVENIQNNVNEIVDEQMSNYLKKEVIIETATIAKGLTISMNLEITLPVWYRVRRQFSRSVFRRAKIV